MLSKTMYSRLILCKIANPQKFSMQFMLMMLSISRKYSYKSWDYNQIHAWIISIRNGHFKRYTKMYDHLKRQKLTGKHLKQLTNDDLRGLGIYDYMDRRLLQEQIKKLR